MSVYTKMYIAALDEAPDYMVPTLVAIVGIMAAAYVLGIIFKNL